jgi:hypothetical protein
MYLTPTLKRTKKHTRSGEEANSNGRRHWRRNDDDYDDEEGYPGCTKQNTKPAKI